MGDADLREWCKDQLQQRLGFAESAVTSFVLALAKKSKDPTALAAQLAAQGGLPADGGTEQFARELYQRVPRQQAERAYQRQERSAAEFARRNEQYTLLEPSREELDAAAAEEQPQQKKKDRHLRKRDKRAAGDGDDDAADEDDESLRRLRERKKKRRGPGALAAEAEEALFDPEKERERDQREKEEFEERLRKRDDERTKKYSDAPKLTKEQLREQERRKYETEEERDKLLPHLREISRQEYLKKREDQKLQELEDAIADEEFLFGDMRMTEKEQRELEYKKTVLAAAKERVKDVDDVVRYQMPTAYDDTSKGPRQDERWKVAYERYREKDGNEQDGNPFAEQELLEQQQLQKAQVAFGTRDRIAASEQARASEFEYVFEDEIDFVRDEMIKGENVEELERAPGQAPAEGARALTEHQKILEGRKQLPIYAYRDALLQAVDEYQVVVIVGETGSGKTTQIPQYLHEAGYSRRGMVGCTQPRRVAAMSVAARVAQEMDVKLGNEVGYSIRFEECTSDKTKLKYMTDGMLLREFLGEPDLASYSVMMVDEAHERTLHTDVLFGLVKDIARFRPDIKLLISSATLDAQKFSDYFDYAPIFRIPGRRYPVDIMYTKAPEADYLDAAVVTALQVHVTQPPGDVLIFLTGQEEIEACEEVLKYRTKAMGSKIKEMIIAPIYANLPSDLQAKIFEPTPPGARKVVIATNIAETSLTIDGVRYVIDPGFCKQKSYNPRSGMESLMVTPISKAASLQRAGRAGRTSAGKCFRMYTAWSYQHELEDNTVPEIQRTNLGNVVLMLKSLGINDLMNFDFMDPPPAETLLRALEQLYALGALNDRGELTKLGRRMAEFPMDPMLSKAVVASEKYKVVDEMLTICAMLGIGNAVYYRPKDKAVHADNAKKTFHLGAVGDHIGLMNVYNTWRDTNFSTQWCYENFVQVRSMKRARDIREQLEGLCDRVEIEQSSDPNNVDAIRKALTAGFFYHTAKLQKQGHYRTVKNPQTVHIHPSSSLSQSLPRWVVYFELVYTSKEYMRQISEIKPEWLVEIAPHYYKMKDIEDGSSKKMPKGKGRSAIDADEQFTRQLFPHDAAQKAT